MNEKDILELENCGVDYREGLEKFMDEAELYEGLLVDFLTENTFDEAKKCLESGDRDGFIKAFHAMKSVTGTLSMNRLYRLCFDTVEAVRSGDEVRARENFGKAYSAYRRIAECISRLLAGREDLPKNK
ncbi:MAG: histidine kinase [Ruminococcus albus]|nr:histidine kinase [Ruminococcus albus]